MHLPAFFASIVIALAGASALGIALLRFAVGQEWLLIAVAGAALLALSRVVRWYAARQPLGHPQRAPKR